MKEKNNFEWTPTILKESLELELIPNILNALKEANPEKAIQLVDNFYHDHAEDEISNEIRNTCDALKASALEQNENFLEALKIRRNLNLNTDQNTELYLYQKIDVIRNLINSDQLEDAAQEAENVIHQRQESIFYPIAMLKLLFIYVQIQERLNITMPEKYTNLAKKISQLLEIDTNDIFNNESSDQLTIAVNRMFYKQKEANKRYQDLVFELDSAIDGDEQDELLERFVNNEEVGYYRKRAQEFFDD